jgi:hypothetical protein
MYEASDVNRAYASWLERHKDCPALYVPKSKPEPTYQEGTGPFADFRIEIPPVHG